MPDNRLKLYIVSCHVDKPLTVKPQNSVYAIPIQAGAALTDMRICDLNDMDDCPDNISDRNTRYSEATAMYWISRHIDTPYTGLCHYRRRLDISDDQYADLISRGIDIITSVPTESDRSVSDYYKLYHYAHDWDLFMNILKKFNREYYDYALTCFSKNTFHPCNLHVFRSDLFRDFCDMAFPVCDEFYKTSPPKTDVFQHRDVGFIMERLSHLYIMHKAEHGATIAEYPITELSSEKWSPESECDLKDPNEVFEACDRLFRINQITKCNNVLGAALNSGLITDNRLDILNRVLTAALIEEASDPESMFEYLPSNFRSDLTILTEIWSGFEKVVKLFITDDNETNKNKLTEYMYLTGFSEHALKAAMEFTKDQ